MRILFDSGSGAAASEDASAPRRRELVKRANQSYLRQKMARRSTSLCRASSECLLPDQGETLWLNRSRAHTATAGSQAGKECHEL